MFLTRKIPSRNNTNVYNVMDIAIHIINYCKAKQRPINNLTLQKLLYFTQAYFMTQTKEKQKIFNASFVAWEFGPACPTTYYEFQHHNGNLASIFTEYLILSTEIYKYNPNAIADQDKIIIHAVVDYYLNFSSSDLVTLSRHQDPWLNTPKGMTITEQAMVRYFSKNKQPIFIKKNKESMSYV